MAQGIFGYFKFNINGTKLTGTYMNRTTPGLEEERGDKIVGDNGVFLGTYNRSWNDSSGFREAILNINNADHNTFQLNWTVTNNDDRTAFRGIGIIDEGALVGFYEMLP